MATLLAAVEATLLGKDERLVAKCDVRGILAVFERWDIYDVDTLLANLASSFAELQIDLAPVAAKSFLALLKATITRVPSAAPPDMPSSAPPTTPFTEAPHSQHNAFSVGFSSTQIVVSNGTLRGRSACLGPQVSTLDLDNRC